MRYFLILLVGWLPLLACALDFDETTRTLPLGHVMQVYEDVEGNASIEQVTSAAFADHFHRQGEAVLNAGYSRSVFWLRVDLRFVPKDPDAIGNWLLELAYPPMDSIELFLPDSTGRFRLSQSTGDELPYSVRQIKQNNYVFAIPFPANQEKTVYLRIHSEGSVQAPLNLWSYDAYIEDQPTRLYVLGLIYGVLLGMLVYNLFIYLSVRDRSYLYYILYIASFGMY